MNKYFQAQRLLILICKAFDEHYYALQTLQRVLTKDFGCIMRIDIKY